MRLPTDEGLVSADDQELLRRVERSQVWRLIRDALCMERERLFAGTSVVPGLTEQPSTIEALWMNRGAILLIQWLLQGVPWFVVEYKHHMAKEAKQKGREKSAPKTLEREFSARPSSEPPDFDL